MGIIIFSVILTIILVGVLGTELNVEKEEIKWSIKPRMFLGLSGLIIILFGCFTTIGANSVGIMYNPFKRRNTKRSNRRRF